MKNLHVRLLFLILALVAGSVYVVVTKPTRKGLDIQGGMRVVLQAKTDDPAFVKSHGVWNQEKLDTVVGIMDRRVNFLGVAEPVVLSQGRDRIVVELPGLRNKDEALKIIQTTAKLEFRYVKELESQWSTREEEKDGKPTGYETIIADGKPVTEEQLKDIVFSQDPILTGSELLPNSMVELGPKGYIVHFEFANGEPKQKFEDFTGGNIGKRLAVFLDNKLISAPTINDRIPGVGIIEGRFTADQAKLLSNQLNAGALPVPLEQLELTNVEATLGNAAVRQTTLAGVVGLALVLIVMAAYYLLPGILADIALILYALFTFAIFKGAFQFLGIPPVTLTVPGIAGFILSIGMAVDANILIFERMKEERNNGKSMRAAIETGFRRAFSAIFDSNVCTLITCGILYTFGTGSVRGFAVTLAIGVVLSMFTAITCSRTFLLLLAGTRLGQNDALYGLHRGFHPKLNVTKRMAFWFGLSGIIIVPGLIFWGMGGIKQSIEFTGGTEFTARFNQSPSANEINQTLASLGHKETRVLIAEGNRAFITTKRLSQPEQDAVKAALIQKGAIAPIEGVQDVSGSISSELKWNAIKAVLIASALIILYLAIRFSIPNFVEGLKFGTSAVVALFHDVGVLWGAFAIMGYFANWKIDSLFVTAMLTVIGFSVHDTIIIFDRIRENLHHKARGESFADVADRSIEQTFARSVNTSGTVVITLLALLFLGGPVIKLFVAALLIGIVSGTYSSIFNATPILVLWKRLSGDAAPGLAGPSGGTARAATRRVETPRPASPSKPAAPAQKAAIVKPDGGGEAPAEAVGITAGAERIKPKKKKRRM